jgi:foldase protein PrsA
LYVKNPRLWVGVGVVVVALALFFFKGLFIAATVNGQPISRLAVVSQLEKQGGKQALDNLIVENLIRQEAQKRHVSVSQSDIDGQIKKIEDQLKGQGMTLDNALAAQGLTKSDLVDQLTIQALLTKMIGNSVSVSDADIEKYIAANQDNLPKDLSDADLKSQVRSQLEQQQLQTKTQAFVATLQKNAKITYFVGY